MAGGKLVRAKQLLHLGGQVEQAQRVGDVGPALADGVGDFFLGLLEVVDQATQTLRLVDRRQVGALQVFDQAELQRLEIVEAAQHYRHVVKLRLLCRAPAPFARDDLVSVLLVADRAHQNRLQQAELLHRVDQHVEPLERRARLILARPQLADRQSERCLGGDGTRRRRTGGNRRRRGGRDRGRDVVVAEKGGETAAQAAWFGSLAHDAPCCAALRRRRMNSLASRM